MPSDLLQQPVHALAVRHIGGYIVGAAVDQERSGATRYKNAGNDDRRDHGPCSRSDAELRRAAHTSPDLIEDLAAQAINAFAAELGYFSMASMALCICTMQAFISFFCIMS